MIGRLSSSELRQAAAFAAATLLVLVLQGFFLANVLRWPATADKGWILMMERGPHVVAITRPAGERAGLRVGDQILRLNGREYRTIDELYALLVPELGQRNVYEIRRGDRQLTVEVPNQPLGWERVLRQSGVILAVGVVFLALGVLVFLMKPFEGPSWAFFGMCALIGAVIPYFAAANPYHPEALNAVGLFVLPLAPAAVLDLAALFPERRPAIADRPLLLALPWLVSATLIGLSRSFGPALRDTPHWLQLVIYGYIFAAILIFLTSTVLAGKRSSSLAVQLRALLIFTGVTIALLIPVTELLSNLVLRISMFPNPIVLYAVSLTTFPLSIGYAIARHDLFEIDVIVRRTYGYLLSTGVVVLLYGTTVSTLNLLVGPSEIARSPFFTVVFVLAVVFLMQPLQGRIQAFVDRAFYRKQVDYRRTIAEVTDRMTQLLEPELVRETLVSSVVREMFLENGLLLAPEAEAGRFEVVMAAGGAPEARSLRLDKRLAEALAEARVPVFRHEIELAPQYAQSRPGMLGSFDELGAELVMPMLYQGQLRAVLSLGRKKSGRMFTREDVDLLRTLVAEGAVALENSRLFDDLAGSLQQVQLLESIRQGLSKFVPQTVQALIAESPDASAIFEKRERDLTVMFADMTGYTRLSSQLPHDQVNAIVERYFGAFLDEILRVGGDVNETAGDGLMVLFQDEDPERHARAAVRAAVGIQRITRVINAEREGEIPIGVHIGINSGIASVGATKIQGGGGMRWTYTASGPTTNIAARIGALGEDIAITEETRRRIGAGFAAESLGPQALKNVTEPIEVFRVTRETEDAAGAPMAGAPVSVPAQPAALQLLAAAPRVSQPALAGADGFVLSGQVREGETGRPLAGLVVRAFDKDLMLDDYLGSGTTDAEGRYEVRFTIEAFRDLFERQPDLYVRVFDAAGRELYSTQDAVRWNVGAVERLDVAVPRERLG